MTVNVDYDRAFLNVDQTVRFTNNSDRSLASVVFNVPPAAFNAFTLSSASVGETAVKPSRGRSATGHPSARAPGAWRDYHGDLALVGPSSPTATGDTALQMGCLCSATGIRCLLCCRMALWERHQYMPRGDAYFSEVADYDVSVSVPPTVTVASSGQTVSRKGGQWVFQRRGCRDFALAMSSHYQTLTRRVDGIAVTVYYLPEQADGAKSAMEITEQAMRWYAKRIGPYPFPSLAVVQVPNGDGQHTAQEHAGLFFIRSDIFAPGVVGIYAAHELAHAWFFAAVGADQIRDPWMDEGLVTSLSLDFYKENYPKEYPGHLGVWGGSRPTSRTLHH